MQPLTVEELSLVVEIMSGKLGISSAKEARALLEGAASSSQNKGKRKRLALPDTRVMDDLEGYKLSKAEAASAPTTKAGTPPASASVEPSPAKATKKERSNSSESARTLTITLHADGFTYSNPSFVKDMSELLLLSADRKRLNDIGLVQSPEWSLAHAYQIGFL